MLRAFGSALVGTVVGLAVTALLVGVLRASGVEAQPTADPRGTRIYHVRGWKVIEFRDAHGRVCTILDRGLDCDFPPDALGVER